MKTDIKKLAFLLLLPVMPILQACGGAGAWEGTVTDSAGVSIVMNTATPMWRAGDAWTASEDLRIGTVAGEPEYQFGRISGLDVAPDGTVYVLDMQARELRAFDAQGSYLRTFGGAGAGPGELSEQALGVFVDPAGDLQVIDLGNQRVNRYHSDGTPAGSFRIDISAGVPARWEMSGDGRLMAQLRGLDVPGMAALAEGDPIVIYDTTGVVVDTLTVLPKGQTIEELSEERISMRVFAPEPLWDLAPDGTVYTAMNDRFQILVSNPDGTLTRIIRKDVERKPVEESDRNAILRAMREQYEEFNVPPQAIEQIMQGIGFADFYPAFGQMFVGPGGNLWVQRIRSAREMAAGAEEEVEFDAQNIGSPEWELYDQEGRYLGVVTLPDRFAPLDAEGDDLYGVWTDELDVQYVVRVRIDRPAE
jgi:hypothetical protein